MLDLTTLYPNIIPLEKFSLHWLLDDEEILPTHSEQFKPLNAKASAEVWKTIVDIRLHEDIPFRKDFFKTIDRAKIRDNNQQEIKKWLYHRGLAFDTEVVVSWEPDEAMLVSWKLFVKYFHVFYHGDITVMDATLNWALLCYHENEIYFGTNDDFEPGNDFQDVRFSW